MTERSSGREGVMLLAAMLFPLLPGAASAATPGATHARWVPAARRSLAVDAGQVEHEGVDERRGLVALEAAGGAAVAGLHLGVQ